MKTVSDIGIVSNAICKYNPYIPDRKEKERRENKMPNDRDKRWQRKSKGVKLDESKRKTGKSD